MTWLMCRQRGAMEYLNRHPRTCRSGMFLILHGRTNVEVILTDKECGNAGFTAESTCPT
jgi:hypothetical protein